MATMPLGTGAELSTGQRAACQYHNLLQKTTSMGSGGSRTEDRRYDAGAGRFISEDFIKGHTAVPYTMNHYSYCFNRPMDMVDLNGMWLSLKDTIGIVAAGIATASVATGLAQAGVGKVGNLLGSGAGLKAGTLANGI